MPDPGHISWYPTDEKRAHRRTCDPPGEWLTCREAAAWVGGVHENTLKRIPSEQLPFLRVGSRGDRRYRVADVAAYIARRTVK